jgi:hypothetical protein
MTPGLRLRRLCDQLTHLADVMDDPREATASPQAVEECLVQLEASAMLLEHQLDEQASLSATIVPALPRQQTGRPVLRNSD